MIMYIIGIKALYICIVFFLIFLNLLHRILGFLLSTLDVLNTLAKKNVVTQIWFYLAIYKHSQ